MPKPLISGSFNDTDKVLLNKLRGALFSKILLGLKEQIDIEDIKLQSYIVQNKLSGQVLHHRSGTLIDSVRVIPAEIKGDRVEGGVQAAGGPAFYGVFFEKGGLGPYTIEPVNKKALAFLGGDGVMVICRKVTHPPIPKLPFMAPSLDENRDGIISRVKQRIVDDSRRVLGSK